LYPKERKEKKKIKIILRLFSALVYDGLCHPFKIATIDNTNASPLDDGADIIHAGSGHDIVVGGGMNDELWGDDGDDILFGDVGHSTPVDAHISPVVLVLSAVPQAWGGNDLIYPFFFPHHPSCFNFYSL
jgi:hypothetical protein